MKKQLIFHTIFYMLFSISIISCNDIIKSESSSNEQKASINFHLDIENAAQINNQKRSILPTNISADSITKVEFSAMQTEAIQNTFEKEYNSVSDFLNDNVVLDVGNYNFVLSLYTGTEQLELYQQDSITKEIVSGENFITFSTKFVTGNGILDLSLFWDSNIKIKTGTAVLLKSNGSTVVPGFSEEPLFISSNSCSYKKNQVPSGIYYVKFLFFDENSNNIKTIFDLVKIKSGLSTQKQIEITDVNTVYTITYNLNGGTWADGFIPVSSFNENTEVVLPTSGMNKENNAFSGWYLNSNTSGTRIEKIQNGTKNNLTVYAAWSNKKKNNIEYISKGYVTNPNPTIYNPDIGIKLLPANREYFDFEGWYTEPEFENKVEIISANCEIPPEILYAKWTTDIDRLSDCVTKGINEYEIIYVEGVLNNGNKIYIGDKIYGSPYKVGLDLSKLIVKSYANFYICRGNAYMNKDYILDYLVFPSNLITIGSSCCYNCRMLKKVVLPEKCRYIKDSCFRSCDALEEILLPDNLTSIGSDAFSGCSKLASIIIPDSVTTLGTNCFSFCSELLNVKLPSDLTEISYGLFQDCSKLTTINLPSKIKKINGYAFIRCKQLEEIIIPISTESIGTACFAECENLRFCINIPQQMTEIPAQLFNSCKSLENIILPDKIEVIGGGSFLQCEKLSEIIIPNTVKEISNDAFSCCLSLSEIEIPKSVEIIGERAFACRNLSLIKYQGTIEEWGSIRLSTNWNLTVPATKVICCDGEIDL